MQYEKVYLDNELSLPQLSEKMSISPQDLSYLINEACGENFFSFINRHRVEEAKRLLLSEKYDQLNILGIAYQAGFNSKTTFNTTFKKQVGLSPSDFVKTGTVPAFQAACCEGTGGLLGPTLRLCRANRSM